MTRKPIREFIQENREEIDKAIRSALNRGRTTPMERTINDKDRRLWLINDEGLYHWALSEGVKV